MEENLPRTGLSPTERLGHGLPFTASYGSHMNIVLVSNGHRENGLPISLDRAVAVIHAVVALAIAGNTPYHAAKWAVGRF